MKQNVRLQDVWKLKSHTNAVDKNCTAERGVNFIGITDVVVKAENLIEFKKSDGSTFELSLQDYIELAQDVSTQLVNLFDYKKAIKNSRRIDHRPENNGYWNNQPLRDLNYDRAVIPCQKGEAFTVVKKATITDTNSIQFTDIQGLHLQSLIPTIDTRGDCQIYTFIVPDDNQITHFNVNIHKETNKTEDTMVFKGHPNITKYEFIPYQPDAEMRTLTNLLQLVFGNSGTNLTSKGIDDIAKEFVLYKPNESNQIGHLVFKNHDNIWGSYNFRIPALLRTQKGTLLAFCDVRMYNGLDNYTIFNGCARSTDDGLTWNYQETMRNEDPNEEYARVMDQTAVELPNGHIMVMCGAWASNEGWTNSATSGGQFPKYDWDVKYVISEDDGQTWSQVESLANKVSGMPDKTVGWFGGVGTGIVMTSERYKDRVIMPIQICNQIGEASESNPTRSGCIYSDDNGQSWTMSSCFTDYNNSENMILEVDSHLIMSSRRDQRAGHRGSYVSTDGGVTWKTYTPLHTKMTNGSTGNSGCQGSWIKYITKNGHQVGLVSYPKTTKNDYTRDTITIYMYDFDDPNAKIKELYIPYPGDACWYGGGYSSMAYGKNKKGEDSLCIVFESLEGISFLDVSIVLDMVEAQINGS